MRTHRFHTLEPLTENAIVMLDKVQSSHISKVLRLTNGQEVTLFNGDGYDYYGHIKAAGKNTEVCISEKRLNLATPGIEIHLAQALARGDRMDYAIQKAVEMGVSEITPLVTEYVQFRLDKKRLNKKLRHWQGIIISALAQCGRADSVTLNAPVTFNDWLQSANTSCVYLHPRTDNQMSDAIKLIAQEDNEQVQIAIGPEGGFSDAEIANVATRQIIGLGNRILRTETAATAVLAVLHHSLQA